MNTDVIEVIYANPNAPSDLILEAQGNPHTSQIIWCTPTGWNEVFPLANVRFAGGTRVEEDSSVAFIKVGVSIARGFQ